MTKRRVFVAAVAFLCGGALGWFVGSRFDPTHAQIRAAAEALVPDGAIVTERGENTGHPIIVGEYFVAVDFEIPGVDPSGVRPALDQRSHNLGYSTQRADAGPGATVRYVVRKPTQARLRALTMPTREGYGQGTIRVEADPESKRDRRMIGGIIGSIGLPALTLLLIRLRKRHRNRAFVRRTGGLLGRTLPSNKALRRGPP